MGAKVKVIHYLNQFFSQIGGEEQAFTKPFIREGAIGPGLLLGQLLGEDYEIISTVVCGDNYMADNTEQAVQEVFDLIADLKPDLFIAGPAFNAGRYGPACGVLSKAVGEKFGIPAVSGMYEENPGAEMYRKHAYIIKTNDSARHMRKDVAKMANIARKLVENIEFSDEDMASYFKQGYRKNLFVEKPGAVRAVDMMLQKMEKKPFVTELEMPKFEDVMPSDAIKEMKNAKIALVTEGGVCSLGNPEGLVASRADKYIEFDISEMDRLSNERFQVNHGGYNNTHANNNPNLIVPLDLMRAYEKEGKIGSIHGTLYSTSGNGTSLANSTRFGEEIAQKLLNDGVDGVVLTAT